MVGICLQVLLVIVQPLLRRTGDLMGASVNNPNREIFSTDIQLDGLSTRPGDPNTLTIQSADTNDTPRDPLQGPIITIIITP